MVIDSLHETIEKQLRKLEGLHQQLARLLRKQYGPQQRGREVSQLNLQYFGEELIVPSGALPLSFQAVRGGMML
jgi:hypothetical protein